MNIDKIDVVKMNVDQMTLYKILHIKVTVNGTTVDKMAVF